ncbi:alpha/beta hydrolase [Sphingobacterium spiritivorum]|uniref:alpha/beta hydrolase n=1 Tax=Sphingobacterium spiritivorum TaxID=258 RepID=UPI003DA6B4A2
MEDQLPIYQTDILGSPYEQLTLRLKDDYEGKAVATVVRRKSKIVTRKAVLYIHGYIDYFFQKEMAKQFNHHGYDFYALDLRKYGRSYLPHQKLFNVRDLREYDEEIDLTLKLIADEGHSSVILSGHSTGGLTVTYYAIRHPHHSLIKGLWANSPFYDFNVDALSKRIAIPFASSIAKVFPHLRLPNGLNRYYSGSLHKDLSGEWDFDLNWKPVQYPYSYAGFIRAIHKTHKVLHKGATLTIPALIMHSHQSKKPKVWNQEVNSSDLVLEVKDIHKYALKLTGDITIRAVENGVHDLVLSGKEVRTKVYETLFSWLKEKNL